MNDSSVSAPSGDELDTTDSAIGYQPDGLDDATEAADVGEAIDLDAIERDLTAVQTALERLNDGSYWTDEVTGDAIPEHVLASFPLVRTVAGSSAS